MEKQTFYIFDRVSYLKNNNFALKSLRSFVPLKNSFKSKEEALDEIETQYLESYFFYKEHFQSILSSLLEIKTENFTFYFNKYNKNDLNISDLTN